MLGVVVGGGALYGAYLYFTRDLPALNVLFSYSPSVSSKVYAEGGELVGEFGVERRTLVVLDRLPRHLIQAFIAAEDARFYEHEGIDVFGIVRALAKNLEAGEVIQGGSTITQQVVKSILLSPERTMARKIKEGILAYQIERQLTKNEILFLYLNHIYLGHGAYGVEAASMTYFVKPAAQLSLAESALLAGLPRAPSRYSPINHFSRAKERQVYVLHRMAKEGYISQDAADRAARAPLRISRTTNVNLEIGPYFIEHVRRYVEETYGAEALYRGGLQIYTTLDVRLQRVANRAVERGLLTLDRRQGFRGPLKRLRPGEVESYLRQMDDGLKGPALEPDKVHQAVVLGPAGREGGYRARIGRFPGRISVTRGPTEDEEEPSPEFRQVTLRPGDVVKVRVTQVRRGGAFEAMLEQEVTVQGALVAVDPETGHVKTLVGGRNFTESQFNRAIQARRQPGSAFKPLIYAAALDRGFTPASVIEDSPISFQNPETNTVWEPRNFEGKFYGPTTLKEALTFSRNVVTVKLLREIGVDYAIQYARKLGITAPLEHNLTIALGSSGVPPLELVSAYGTFAAGGQRAKPIFIKKIVDRSGAVLEQRQPELTPAISPETAYLMTHLLQNVVQDGTARRVRALGRPAAGKTGTTNEYVDAWFIGYVPNLVAGAWVGYDDQQPLGRLETGARAALPIWLEFMQGAVEGRPVEPFTVPPGIIFYEVNPKTGTPATSPSEESVLEPFRDGTGPGEAGRGRLPDGAGVLSPENSH
ncbi:MAG: PBP1A family penicillin-binding protein [Deltaproteobacteria bacterium]|nr:PBP1A family penicillin-binding protein [Deltaproteobacteria bacterium]MBI3077975.1 PBP1A family penicillin-binding protein [Deltaproteobacteria bacterium]